MGQAGAHRWPRSPPEAADAQRSTAAPPPPLQGLPTRLLLPALLHEPWQPLGLWGAPSLWKQTARRSCHRSRTKPTGKRKEPPGFKTKALNACCLSRIQNSDPLGAGADGITALGPPSWAQAPFGAVAAHEALAASGIPASGRAALPNPRGAQRRHKQSPGSVSRCPPRPPARADPCESEQPGDPRGALPH